MTVQVITKTQVEVATLHIQAGVAHWQNTEVNGKPDEDGTQIPCRKGDNWCPIIDLETGIITNWEKGTEADVHYRVVDNGTYALHNAAGGLVAIREGIYVPDFLAINEQGWGDYIILQIDVHGQIKDWSVPDLSLFDETN